MMLDTLLAAEAAAALAHGGKRLRKALEALSRFDQVPDPERTERAALVAEAGDALWCYVVHREILGLLDTNYILREYQVPDEVRKSMGPRRRSTSA